MTLFHKSLGLFTVVCTALVLIAAVITPAKASHRMVLAEEITNVY